MLAYYSCASLLILFFYYWSSQEYSLLHFSTTRVRITSYPSFRVNDLFIQEVLLQFTTTYSYCSYISLLHPTFHFYLLVLLLHFTTTTYSYCSYVLILYPTFHYYLLVLRLHFTTTFSYCSDIFFLVCSYISLPPTRTAPTFHYHVLVLLLRFTTTYSHCSYFSLLHARTAPTFHFCILVHFHNYLLIYCNNSRIPRIISPLHISLLLLIHSKTYSHISQLPTHILYYF